MTEQNAPTTTPDIGERSLTPIRRVVTGHDNRGRSVVVSDGPAEYTFAFPGVPDYGATDLWRTIVPADNRGPEETCEYPVKLSPPDQGVTFRFTHFPPDHLFIGGFDTQAAFGALPDGAGVADSGEHRATMHRTRTVDLAVVVRGEVYAILDDEEILLKQGDTLIQRGTIHGWSNRSETDCLVAFVLVDALPLDDQTEPQAN